MSLDFWRVSGAELAHPRPGGVPPAALWLIRALNLVFNFLNILWFSKMLRGAIKVQLILSAFAVRMRSSPIKVRYWSGKAPA